MWVEAELLGELTDLAAADPAGENQADAFGALTWARACRSSVSVACCC